ncbi:unnamed protein product [Caenorhabditis bovis]|uniref:Exonuclease domain-containing protein n=1 Tax=Caenorhabditis bovis TaxID=2654633 RepID=A0A8S1E958_9PELO|nr:unnamed protein product [Caenorhabditis bovis]
MFAIDCEMCITEVSNSELTRISVVNEDGDILLDTLVMPKSRIVNYLTEWSGITPELMEGVTVTLKDVQAALRRILPPDAILVGHSLEHDLRALKMAHPYCIDASMLLNYGGQRKERHSLKNLAELFLKEKIQMGYGHCSYEDAWAAMKLVKLKLDKGLIFGNVSYGWDYSKYLKDNDREHIPAKKRRTSKPKSVVLSTKKIPKCQTCDSRTIVNCTVRDCECVRSAGPVTCAVCYVDKNTEEGTINWEDALLVDDKADKEKHVKTFLDGEKAKTVLCGFRSNSLKKERTKGIIHKPRKKHESHEDYVERMLSEILAHNLALIEMNYDEKEVKLIVNELQIESDKEIQATIAEKMDTNIERLINGASQNSLILLVLTSPEKSILYINIK